MTTRILIFAILFPAMGCSQSSSTPDRQVGGRCEGCEALFEYGNRKLSSTDTLPDFNDDGPKMKVTGTIYKRDGRTPAAGVILYVYHTDQTGEYPRKGDEQGWARRHGYIRGWIRTGEDGRYTFYTLRPGAYPGRENPEHIHPIIKEPGYAPYWIDEYLFDDDPILTEPFRRNQPGRGGRGIVRPRPDNGMLVVERDIILGLNVPGYN